MGVHDRCATVTARLWEGLSEEQSHASAVRPMCCNCDCAQGLLRFSRQHRQHESTNYVPGAFELTNIKAQIQRSTNFIFSPAHISFIYLLKKIIRLNTTVALVKSPRSELIECFSNSKPAYEQSLKECRNGIHV